MLKVASENDVVAQERAITRALGKCAELFDFLIEDTPTEAHSMLRYIHAHLFEQSLSVGCVRAACGMRNHNVTTKFRRSVGMGVWEYITARRLEAAASILSSQQVSIYLLAGAVGYSEESFSKAFKSAYGCSPGQYRIRRLGNNNQSDQECETVETKKGTTLTTFANAIGCDH